jgi:hypothetical protein
VQIPFALGREGYILIFLPKHFSFLPTYLFLSAAVLFSCLHTYFLPGPNFCPHTFFLVTYFFLVDALGQRKKKDPATGAEISTMPAAAEFLAKCRKQVAYFKRSGQRMDSMKEEQEELYNKTLTLFSDHFIRWNSSELMMQRLLTVREALQAYFNKHDPISDAQLSAAEWSQVANLVGLLGPLLQATQRLQSSDILLSNAYATIKSLLKSLQPTSNVSFPILTQQGVLKSCAHEDLDDISRAVRERLNEQMQHRFSDEKLLTKPMLFALAMDPRMKNLAFLSQRQRKEAVSLLNAEWKARAKGGRRRRES